MTATTPLIRSLADIQAIEAIPLAERDLPNSTYELIGRSAQRAPDATVLTFLLQGSDIYIRLLCANQTAATLC